MLNIALCDDDLVFLSYIKKQVEYELFNNNLEFNIDMFSDSKNLLNALSLKNYNLIFLDIDMPNLTGIELVKNYLHEKELSIVFVTNRDDLVFEALKCQPINFIRKSHLKDELSLLIQSFLKKYFIKQQYYDFNVNKSIKRIYLCNILYIENKKHYINVICKKSSDSFTTKMSMKCLEKELNNPTFIRIHIGYLVNSIHIKQIGYEFVLLDNEIKLPISRHRMEEVKKAFQVSRRLL